MLMHPTFKFGWVESASETKLPLARHIGRECGNVSTEREAVREKLAQARRLLEETVDPVTTERLRSYIEKLEQEMLSQMGKGRE